jgi:hypothetical protein
MPWALKNWMFTGNPVFPFLTFVFPSIYMSDDFLQAWTEAVFNHGIRTNHFYLTLLWQIALDAKKLIGYQLGPFFLITPFFLFVKKKSITIWFLFLLSFFGIMLWISNAIQPRFLLQYWGFVTQQRMCT